MKPRKSKKTKFIVLAVIGVILVAGIAFLAHYIPQLEAYRKTIEEMVIRNVDLNQVPDGIYEGAFDAGMVGALVRVTVRDHEIRNIELLRHNHGRGEKAEVIIDHVQKAQSLQVDFVTGATASSKVILKAIENALR